MTTTITKPFLVIDMPKIYQILEHANFPEYKYQLENFDEQFRRNLYEELAEFIEDAVEIAFYRTIPAGMGEGTCGECEETPCTCGHDYKYKGHCDSCSDSWWSDHDLHECIEQEEIDYCNQHQDHPGEECDWVCSKHSGHKGDACNWECDDHYYDHELEECLDRCQKMHSHDEWDLATDVGTVSREEHDGYFSSDCEHFAEPDDEDLTNLEIEVTPF